MLGSCTAQKAVRWSLLTKGKQEAETIAGLLATVCVKGL